MSAVPETRPSLIVRLRDAQDERAWSEFLAIYESLIERLAFKRGLQHADARELVQEVLIAVSKAVENWNPDPARGSFRGWLLRIARNLAINLAKREGRIARGSGDSDLLRLLELQPDPAAEQTAEIDLEFRRQAFTWAAEQIRQSFEESTWTAFWKTCVEQQPVDEVAAELRLTRGAVYVARSRVMARLRKEVSRVLDQE